MIRKPNGAKLLVPEWMTLPEAGAIRIVSSPRLSVNRLMELRDFIDRLMLTSSVEARVSGGQSSDTFGAAQIGSVQDTTIDRTVTTTTNDSIGVIEDASYRSDVRHKNRKRRKERSGGQQ